MQEAWRSQKKRSGSIADGTMRAWDLARPGLNHCGGCPAAAIPEGTPVLLISLTGIRWPRVRCLECAAQLGEQPDAGTIESLLDGRAALEEASHLPRRVLPRRRAHPRSWPRRLANVMNGQPIDVKARQVGDG